MNKKIQYYSLDNILKHEGQYYIIYGERSNGKSYATAKYVLDKYFTTGEQFVICKRFQEDMSATICSTMLTPLYDYVLKEYGYHIRFFQSKWYATQDIDTPITKQEVIGYAQALNTVERYKGSQYPKVTTIIFEEFMSLKGNYIPSEINLLLNLVSTITRKRTNVKVFMLGNAISKYSPYSDALGIRLDKLKFNDIIEKKFKYGKVATTFVIERSKHVAIDDNTSSYSNFGKVNSSMINEGMFETSQYNHFNDNVCFNENQKEFRQQNNCKPKVLMKKDKVPVCIYYNEEYFSIYIKSNNTVTVGIKKCETNKAPKDTIGVINGNVAMKNAVNIKNICYYKGNKVISNILDTIVTSFYNDDIIFPTDEIGEDVITAFKLCGLSK